MERGVPIGASTAYCGKMAAFRQVSSAMLESEKIRDELLRN